jgi:hypothetical protein
VQQSGATPKSNAIMQEGKAWWPSAGGSYYGCARRFATFHPAMPVPAPAQCSGIFMTLTSAIQVAESCYKQQEKFVYQVTQNSNSTVRSGMEQKFMQKMM